MKLPRIPALNMLFRKARDAYRSFLWVYHLILGSLSILGVIVAHVVRSFFAGGVKAPLTMQQLTSILRNTFREQLPEVSLDSPNIISKNGYPVEIHRTRTKDGFNITMHRIPSGREAGIQPTRSDEVSW